MRHDLRAIRRYRHLIGVMIAATVVALFAVPTVQAVGTDSDVSAIKEDGRTVKLRVQGRAANTLKRQCVRAGLTKPKIYLPQINFAGVYSRQVNITGVQYRPLPDKCNGRFQLRSLGMFQGKRPGEKRWRSLHGYLEAIQISPSAFDDELTSHYERATFHNKRGDSFYIRRGERARVLILNKVVNAKDKVVARRWFAKRAKIYRGKGKPIFEATLSSERIAEPPVTGINARNADQPVRPTFFAPNYITNLTDGQPLKNYVDYIQWSSWGGQQAIGTGRLALLDPVGSTTPVTVVLSDLKRCVGQRVYTSYSLQLPAGAPAPWGWPKGQSGKFPCLPPRVAGHTPNDGTLCAFEGIEDPKANEEDYTFPAQWRPHLPGGKNPSLHFCLIGWKHWGKRVVIGKAVAEIGGKRPHSGRQWPVKLELRHPFWCPRVSGLSPITYRTLRATFYGKGYGFQSATTLGKALNRMARIRAQVGRRGLKPRVYRQHITPSRRDCQPPFGLLRPPKITRED